MTIIKCIEPVEVTEEQLRAAAKKLGLKLVPIAASIRSPNEQCSECDTVVSPADPYYATPCGTFCSQCMEKHAKECGVCAHEFDLK